ncbi:hypothetical protein TrVGV298_002222 [Trichoderma virens]|nr:hypothetical protein TrVGV298_002222 [Trichoderma virens]
MTDTSASSELNKTTVAAAANQCLESFQRCLLREPSLHPRELSMVEDQVARFSTWTSGIGVFAPGRASMDHRLRYAPEVQSIAIGLLESLNYRIRKFSEVLDKHAKGPETLISSVLDDGLGRFLGDIATEISHLNKMSNIIRRASQENHNVQAKDFHLKDEEGNDIEPLLLDHYKRYIGDRFPTASITIQQRLADAMILRRKRILYKRFRHGNKTIQLPQLDTKVSITMPDSRLQQGDNQKAKAPSRIQSATTLQPDKFKMIASSPSVVSTTMTVALGNHEALDFPIAPGLQVKRKYEQLKAEKLVAHQAMFEKSDEPFPAIDSTVDPDNTGKDAPERISTENDLKNNLKSVIQAIGEITCPYCLYTLPLEEVFNKQKWHNHVKNDLDSYVCLFEGCNQPDELYKHSDKWLSHMHQHGQRWRCPSHRELGMFLSNEEYMQHMRDVHDTKLSDAKLRALASRNARSLPKLFPLCPLCGKDESEVGGRLSDHITGHLRSLALKSLPSYEEDIPDDVGSENDSSNGSGVRSRSTLDMLDDDDIREFWSTKNDDSNHRTLDPDIDSNNTPSQQSRQPPPLPSRFPCWCRAIYSWAGESKRDLSFIEGDLIECINAGDGSWWVGRLFRDRTIAGAFPSNFVEVLPEDFQPTKPPSSISPNTASGPKAAPQKSQTFRKPFEAYANYHIIDQSEVFRETPTSPPAPPPHRLFPSNVGEVLPEDSQPAIAPTPIRLDRSGSGSQSPKITVYKCDEPGCGQSFDQPHKLNHHRRYHSRDHKCPYPDCGKGFSTKTHLQRHINDKHEKEKKFAEVNDGVSDTSAIQTSDNKGLGQDAYEARQVQQPDASGQLPRVESRPESYDTGRPLTPPIPILQLRYHAPSPLMWHLAWSPIDIDVENTSGEKSHQPQPSNNIAAEKVAAKQPQWGGWSSWVLDEQNNRYYRFRQDSEGNLDYDWDQTDSAATANARKASQTTPNNDRAKDDQDLTTAHSTASQEMWTEITKDLVLREAIEELGYEYEETDQFWYVLQYLQYCDNTWASQDDVLQLAELSDDIRRARSERHDGPLPESSNARSNNIANYKPIRSRRDESERVREREVIYDRARNSRSS